MSDMEMAEEYNMMSPKGRSIYTVLCRTYDMQCYYSFVSWGGLLSTLPSGYTVLRSDPAAHQVHCGRCRIRIPDVCLRSRLRYE